MFGAICQKVLLNKWSVLYRVRIAIKTLSCLKQCCAESKFDIDHRYEANKNPKECLTVNNQIKPLKHDLTALLFSQPKLIKGMK